MMRLSVMSLLPVLCLAASVAFGQPPDGKAAIRAIIVDADSRQPIAGVQVNVSDDFRAVTESDGVFRVPPPLVEGACLELRHPDYHTVRLTDLIVPPGYTSYLHLAMTLRANDAPVVIRFDGTYNRSLPTIQTLEQDSITAKPVETMLRIADGFKVESDPWPEKVPVYDEDGILPTQTVDALLSQVLDVPTTTTGEVCIRGTYAGEVSYIVDDAAVAGIKIEQVKGEKELALWQLQSEHNELIRLCARLLGDPFADSYDWTIEELMQACRDRVARLK